MLFQQQAQSLVVQTPAKLNLFLEIFGKRDDGFHELETLMVSVSLYDTLIFQKEATEQIHLHCFDASQRSTSHRSISNQPSFLKTIPDNENNLVMRAARLLQEQTGTSNGIRINLHKRIPAAAGLAGGSSDAAATLAGLNRFWNLNLEHDELCQLASQLGSDVPFFLSSSPMAICRGRGELIEPCSFRGHHHFIITQPATGLSTPKVFQQYHERQKTSSGKKQVQPKSVKPLLTELEKGRLSTIGQHFHNALQAPARELNSEINQLTELFEAETVCGHLMSGSGSAYFGLCSSQKEAQRIANSLRTKGVLQTFVVSTSL